MVAHEPYYSDYASCKLCFLSWGRLADISLSDELLCTGEAIDKDMNLEDWDQLGLALVCYGEVTGSIQ